MAAVMPEQEVARRYARVREAMGRDGLDAVIVSGNEYTGFEGAVTYMSGFVIVHRYAYVLLPLEGEPSIVFPREARYVGEHGTSWIDDQVFVDRPGDWLADRVRGKRVGVYGLDYVMTVRDHTALAEAAELVAWDVAFDHARAVKSDLELASVRDSVRINTEGFWIFLEHFAPGRTEREVLAPCETLLRRAGVRPPDDGHGPDRAERLGAARVQDRRRRCDRRDGPGAPVARDRGTGRALGRGLAGDLRGPPGDDTSRMLEAYEAYYEAAQGALRDGATAHEVHSAVSRGFVERGYTLGHVTGHSIGMTMIEFPKIGEGDETELREGMVFSMHPHAIAQDGRACLYMQDTWLVTAEEGVPLAGLPMRIFDGTEVRP